MKKLFAIAFTCVYLTLTVGVATTTHYCMGRVKSTTLFSFGTSHCCCTLFSDEPCHSCCDDETDFVAIEDEYSAGWVLTITPLFYQLGDVLYAIHDEPQRETRHLNVDATDAGPPPTVPLFKQHCSFVFYDQA